MNIVLGSDHAAFSLKSHIKEYIPSLGYAVCDVGTFSEESCDYPLFAQRAAKKILLGECELGILICGTGIGMSLAANKIWGIRCAVCNDIFSAEMARLHNDANMLAMGARIVDEETAEQIVRIFLATSFQSGRHQKRVDMITAIEAGENIEDELY
ncbi:MAG: ribose 5-phosphate isomerase B [Oscillospiraceae bacterium]|nr:ribose 5-phosphate isomerase B [Oscillospiraceae bacterium]